MEKQPIQTPEYYKALKEGDAVKAHLLYVPTNDKAYMINHQRSAQLTPSIQIICNINKSFSNCQYHQEYLTGCLECNHATITSQPPTYPGPQPHPDNTPTPPIISTTPR